MAPGVVQPDRHDALEAILAQRGGRVKVPARRGKKCAGKRRWLLCTRVSEASICGSRMCTFNSLIRRIREIRKTRTGNGRIGTCVERLRLHRWYSCFRSSPFSSRPAARRPQCPWAHPSSPNPYLRPEGRAGEIRFSSPAEVQRQGDRSRHGDQHIHLRLDPRESRRLDQAVEVGGGLRGRGWIENRPSRGAIS